MAVVGERVGRQRILHNPSLIRQSPTAPLVIYLPPYPSSTLRSPPAWILKEYSVLNIPYRWSYNPSVSFRIQKSHAFPIPLHDTLQAYTWLLTNYLPSLSPPSPATPSSQSPSPHPPPTIQRPLLIYGSYLGGTLATSLALTESFVTASQTTKIHGLIVHNGIFDWTVFSTTPDPVLSSPITSPYLSTEELYAQKPWTINTLHSLKTRLFPSAAKTFDSFASPVLFFRTSGIQVPSRWPVPPPPEKISNLDNEDDSEKIESSSTETPSSVQHPPDAAQQSPYSDAESDTETTSDPLTDLLDLEPPADLWDDDPLTGSAPQHEPLETYRRWYLQFPSMRSTRRIPRTLFLYDDEGSGGNEKWDVKDGDEEQGEEIWRDQEMEGGGMWRYQAEEMARLMKRSVRMYELRDRVMWDEDCDPEAIAGGRVGVRGLVSGGGDDGKDEDAVGSEEFDVEKEKEMEKVVKEWIEEGGL